MCRSTKAQTSLLLLAMSTALGALPSMGTAQAVRGQVLEQGTEQPIQGAMVLLLDGAESVQSGFLSDETGHYILRASGSGSYRVRVERIGYPTTTSSTFRVGPRETHALDLFLSPEPLDLNGIDIRGEGRCLVRPDEGMRVAQVWEEARKALANQEWTSRGGFLKYQIERYRKELDHHGRPMEEEDRAVASLVGETPIRSLSAEDLSTHGYIRPSGDDTYDYFGPDARVLLSDAFLDTHCFRLVRDRDQPGRIGLAFRPVRQRKVPDIQGTFWVDREAGTLELLEYSYTWTPWTEAQGVARGRVEFENLVTGAWVIRRWWIRMPLMVMDHAVRRLGGEGLRVRGVREEGGEVTKVSLLEGGRIVDRVTAQAETRELPKNSH